MLKNDKQMDKLLNIRFNMRYIEDRILLAYYTDNENALALYKKDVRDNLKQLRDDITFWLEDDFVASIGKGKDVE